MNKVIELMSLILSFDQETELKVRKTIERIGIRTFLLNINSLDFSDEIKEKVNTLKEIIKMNDNYVQSVDPVKGGHRDDK